MHNIRDSSHEIQIYIGAAKSEKFTLFVGCGKRGALLDFGLVNSLLNIP